MSSARIAFVLAVVFAACLLPAPAHGRRIDKFRSKQFGLQKKQPPAYVEVTLYGVDETEPDKGTLTGKVIIDQKGNVDYKLSINLNGDEKSVQLEPDNEQTFRFWYSTYNNMLSAISFKFKFTIGDKKFKVVADLKDPRLYKLTTVTLYDQNAITTRVVTNEVYVLDLAGYTGYLPITVYKKTGGRGRWGNWVEIPTFKFSGPQNLITAYADKCQSGSCSGTVAIC